MEAEESVMQIREDENKMAKELRMQEEIWPQQLYQWKPNRKKKNKLQENKMENKYDDSYKG